MKNKKLSFFWFDSGSNPFETIKEAETEIIQPVIDLYQQEFDAICEV